MMINFTLNSAGSEISGFELGNIDICIDDVEITSRNKFPSQAMMIFVSITDLLDCIRFLIENKKQRITFNATDSSFSLNFKKNGKLINIENNNKKCVANLYDFSKVLYESAAMFSSAYLNKIKDVSVFSDLENSLKDFEFTLKKYYR